MTQVAFGQVAPVSRRAVAYVIDALIAAGLGIVLGTVLVVAATLSGSPEGMLATLALGAPLISLLMLGWFVVYTLMQSRSGSIGMRAQGLRLVRADDGGPLGFGRTLLRNVIFGLAASIVVGYFTPLFDGSGRFQGWHDKVAGSLMLDARTARTPDAMTAPASPALPQPAFERTPPPGFPTPPSAVPARPDLASPASRQPADPAPSALAFPQPAFPQPAFPAPPRPPLPEPAAPAAAAPVSDIEETQLQHRPAPSAAPDAGLIAFVPGVTQDGPPQRADAPPAPQTPTGPAVPPPAAPAAPGPDLPAVPAPAPPASPVPEPATPAEPAPAVEPPAVPAPAVEPPAVPAPAAPASAADAADDIEETRISVPGHRLVFTWDDGTRVTVSRRTVFGRNPNAEPGALAVAVRDETLSLSKTHFEAAAEASGGWVRDLHSTNGMTIVRDGQRIACPAGQQVPVRLGDAIEIGDRVVTIGGYA
ncbi:MULTISPECIES: RDD family protein [Microbacterium]|uniref:RDD family protein n=1 Tax=Microbacterium TaxID=33882 RepID=UPI00217DFB47|nr:MULTISPECIES: RDD family protein [Microbacterium]UWF77720.1 RDD family protein [Microbacterium neungamense]WCM55889.1 RDD family protein [Microbacterium sp. EF45047]